MPSVADSVESTARTTVAATAVCSGDERAGWRDASAADETADETAALMACLMAGASAVAKVGEKVEM